VVDDAIVVVENVERGITEGLTPRAAAHRSMDEVAGPIIAISLVLCAVFVPPALVPGFNGAFYRQFALTIAFASILSAISSLTLSPALCALLLQPHNAAPDRLQRFIDRSLGWFFAPFNRMFNNLSERYQRGVRKVLRSAAIGLFVYAGLLLLAGLGFARAPSGFVPAQDKGYLVTAVQLPPAASIERTEAVVRRIGEIALQQPGILHAVQFPGLSVNGFTRGSNTAVVFLTLKPFEERGRELTGDKIIANLNQKLSVIDDAFIAVIQAPPIRGFGPAGGFKMELEDRTESGSDNLYAVTQEILAKTRSSPELVGTYTNFEVNAPQYFADVDRVKAKRMGVELGDVFQTLQAYLGSYYVNDFNQFGRTFRVMVQADEHFRAKPQDALLLKTRNHNGDMVPLGTLMTLKDSHGPITVQRYNGFASSDINGRPGPGVSSGQGIAALEKIARETLPAGMTFSWTEITYQQVVASGALAIVLPLCVLLVFLVLAAQYESLSLPLAVILIVPMCMLSAVAGILLMKSEINIFTQIGFFVLIALAAKNAILIVEFARELHEQGRSIVDAALEASRLRLRPIIMTSFAFVFGVLPLVIASGAGAEIRQAMGIATFFGMLGVTLFGVFFTPLFYVVIQQFVADRKNKRAAVSAAPAIALQDKGVAHE
jgi:hydrophobe/amphiphile efflux-1 (HAE1) family protein